MSVLTLTDSARFPFGPQDEQRLATAGVAVRLVPGHGRDEVIAAAPGTDVLLVYSAQIDREVIERLTNCRLVIRCGAGYDNIDVAAARAHGIEVSYVPGYASQDVAEHALALMLACSRRVVSAHQAVASGQWPAYAAMGTMHRLRGRILGLVGFGHIARELARMGRGIGMRVVACDPQVSDEAFAEAGVRRLDLYGLVSTADVVSLHVPLTSTTEGFFDAALIARMRTGALFINTSRGELIDQPALARALRDGRLGGAGLDVLAEEPPARAEPLLSLANVVITPHSAAFTEEALADLRSRAVDDALRALAGHRPAHPVPAEV
jgi:phosphoglycerate dehydrogenase-like enzyme